MATMYSYFVQTLVFWWRCRLVRHSHSVCSVMARHVYSLSTLNGIPILHSPTSFRHANGWDQTRNANYRCCSTNSSCATMTPKHQRMLKHSRWCQTNSVSNRIYPLPCRRLNCRYHRWRDPNDGDGDYYDDSVDRSHVAAYMCWAFDLFFAVPAVTFLTNLTILLWIHNCTIDSIALYCVAPKPEK